MIDHNILLRHSSGMMLLLGYFSKSSYLNRCQVPVVPQLALPLWTGLIHYQCCSNTDVETLHKARLWSHRAKVPYSNPKGGR